MTQAEPRYTPYQAEFFHRFIAEVGPGSMHLLLAPVGTGKTFAMAGSISELARIGRVQRVLILTPAAHTEKWAYLLDELGQDAVVIDGRTLRLLREQTGRAPGQWPTSVYAMSIDLAKRPDVQDLLVAIPWDLVVVDEAHLLAGQRLSLVESLLSRQPRPALLLATKALGPGTAVFADRAVLIDWREAVARARAEDGHEALVIRSVRSYRRSDEEIAVARQVLRVARELGQKEAMILLQRAASSISSLEDSLVQWVENPDQPPGHRGALEELLEEVEQLRRDSRLDCFNRLLEELVRGGVGHVVVFCEYRSTQEYLAAAVERLDLPDYQLHSGLNAARRAEVLKRFTNEGGLLITTAALEGISLNFVDVVIHYDLPISPAAFAQREGRYHRYGRRQRCTVYFLYDETRALPLEGLQLRMAQEVSLEGEERSVDIEDLLRSSFEHGQGKKT